MNREAVLRDIAGKLPVKPNARKRQIWIACLLVGVASFAFLLVTNPLRAWGSWTVNTLYFLGIAEGALAFAAAYRLANGKWGGPIVRIAESFSAYLPIGIATLVVLLVAGIWKYLSWTQAVEPRIQPFLNVPFLYVRTLGGALLFWWLARKMVRTSLRPDLQALKPHVSPELKPEYEKLTANWKGDEAERDWNRHELAHLSPQVALAFAVFFTVLAWDFIMLLTPNWVTGLFGWFVWAGAFICGVAATALMATQLRSKYRLEAYIRTNMFWDIGKVLFAWCIFWGYLFWSQYLPIWYANMPEETWWVFLRFEEPWRTFSFAAFTLIFVIPLVGLLNKTSKTNPILLLSFSLIVLAGVWIERHVLVMPSLNAEHAWIGLPEVGVTIGFLGLFGWAVQGFLTKFPAVNVMDVLSGAHGPEH